MLPGSRSEIRLSTWLITHPTLEPRARLEKGKKSGMPGISVWKVTEGKRRR